MKYKVPIITAITALGMVMAAQAAPVTGSITFSGGVQLDTGTAAAATEVTAWHGPGIGDRPVVISSDGSFAGVLPLTPVDFTASYVFDNPLGHPALWSVGGFTFDLNWSVIDGQGINAAGRGFVDTSGLGMIIPPPGSGLDPTLGTWSFGAQDPPATGPTGQMIFSFSAATGALPDGGSTLVLLGAGFAAMGFFARRFRSQKA